VRFLKSYIKLLFLDKQEKEFFYFVKNQLGFLPNNILYYRKALTHKSVVLKLSDGKVLSNERLEFLGDTILDSIISEYLFTRYKDKDEGFLTQMRAKLVNRKTLNEIAVSLKLHKYIKTNNISIDSNNVLGNAFEALVGAIYLDKGYTYTRKFLVKNVITKYYDFRFLESVDTNFKSRLLEYTQKSKQTVSFETREENSTEKGKQVFISVVLVDNKPICETLGASKKEAEQNVSKMAIKVLEI
jgi:ribonuclease III